MRLLRTCLLTLILLSLLISLNHAQEANNEDLPRVGGEKTAREPWQGWEPGGRVSRNKVPRLVCGRVLASETDLPLAGIAVYDSDGNRAITDDGGRYSFYAMFDCGRPLEVELRPHKPGHRHSLRNATLNKYFGDYRFRIDPETGEVPDLYLFKTKSAEKDLVVTGGINNLNQKKEWAKLDGRCATLVFLPTGRYEPEFLKPVTMKDKLGGKLTIEGFPLHSYRLARVQGRGFIQKSWKVGEDWNRDGYHYTVAPTRTVLHGGELRDIRDDAPLSGILLTLGTQVSDSFDNRALAVTDASGHFSAYARPETEAQKVKLEINDLYWTAWCGNMIATGYDVEADTVKEDQESRKPRYLRTGVLRRLRPIVSFKARISIKGTESPSVNAELQGYVPRSGNAKGWLNRPIFSLDRGGDSSRRFQATCFNVDGEELVFNAQLFPWGLKQFRIYSRERDAILKQYVVEVPPETWTLSNVYEDVKLVANQIDMD